MRVLHLLSNRKWTACSEPAARLALAQRAEGVQADFLCGRAIPGLSENDSAEVHARNLGLDPLLLRLPKHFNPWAVLFDLPRLRARIQAADYDILHAHMANAHLMAALARPREATARVVLHSYEAEGPPRGARASWLLKRHTHGVILLSARARDKLVERFGFPGERSAVIEPGIEVDFFHPDRRLSGAAAAFSGGAGDWVFGMVTRIRSDRRVDLALRILRRLAADYPGLRFLLVGRGEQLDEIRGLAVKLGVHDRVIYAGYCRGDMLVAAYRCMRALFYPVPGTDQSCRTAREAMAAGVPVIASSLGFLPDLVTHGRTGFVGQLSEEYMANALRRLLDSEPLRRQMRENCLQEAATRFPLALQARRTVEFYQALLS